MARSDYFVGLMSGTSLDGVDAVVAQFDGPSAEIIASASEPFTAELRASLLALNTSGPDEVHRAALAGNALAERYAQVVRNALATASLQVSEVAAIGCHGQTVRHRPDLGYTTQIGNAALLAELTGLTVVADFRSRDVAAGGQGAPLVPAFHARILGSPAEDRLVLNLGGIANISCLPANGDVSGFDCGPGNCLLDLWASRHLGAPFDAGGRWAAQGSCDEALLQEMLREPYFSAPPPKSTGRDLFNEAWLDKHVTPGRDPADVQATLVELTARTVALAARSCPGARRLIACGGGVHNERLLERISALLAPMDVGSTATFGIDPDLVEALAFAWLAKCALEGTAGNLPAVTGAAGLRVLGAIYPR